jgi:aryl-alcohol dehydrogenase-like predicted oxidoreductase
VLRQPNVASAIIGATSPEQVRENVAAADLSLSHDLLHEVEMVLTAS